MLYNEENIDVVMENERSKDVGPSLKKKTSMLVILGQRFQLLASIFMRGIIKGIK